MPIRRVRLIPYGQRLAKTSASMLRKQVLSKKAGQNQVGKLISVPLLEADATIAVLGEEACQLRTNLLPNFAPQSHTYHDVLLAMFDRKTMRNVGVDDLFQRRAQCLNRVSVPCLLYTSDAADDLLC